MEIQNNLTESQISLNIISDDDMLTSQLMENALFDAADIEWLNSRSALFASN